VASVKADCATVAKVEAGVTVRSMIPTIKADCVNVAKTIVGSGEDLKNMKRDTDELKKNYTMLKESYDTLLQRSTSCRCLKLLQERSPISSPIRTPSPILK
jgi:hypothetical protein